MDRRILFINPNASAACTAGIAAAIAPFGPGMAVAQLPGGPPAIASWRDWFAVAEPLCRFVEAHEADAYVIACVSDPGFDAVRQATARPVFGLFRSAVAAAAARGDGIGVLGFTAASEARHRRILQAMGLESRLAAWEALDLPMEVLTDPFAPQARIAAASRALRQRGAGTVILGCAGLAGHAALAAAESGLPVIEPCRAAAALASLALLEEAVASTAA